MNLIKKVKLQVKIKRNKGFNQICFEDSIIFGLNFILTHNSNSLIILKVRLTKIGDLLRDQNTGKNSKFRP